MKNFCKICEVSDFLKLLEELHKLEISTNSLVQIGQLKHFDLTNPKNLIPRSVLSDFFISIKKKVKTTSELLKLLSDFEHSFVSYKTQHCDFASVIENVLNSYKPGYLPSLKYLALHFNTSESTLKRILKSEHTKFSNLLENILYEKAVYLLTTSNMNIILVSEYLGYSDSTNFIRSFKKWSGTTPGNFRQKVAC